MKISIGLILSLIFITMASANTFSVSVSTSNNANNSSINTSNSSIPTSTWSIHRDSETLVFDYSQSVQGTISPVDYKGRSMSPYYSGYQDVKMNDVRLRDRTSALQGNYKSVEQMYLQSDDTNEHVVNIYKPVGNVTSVQISESWPVILKSNKAMEYSGKEINNRESAGNNLDFVSSNLLYNKELSKETNVGMSLQKMNATVLVINTTAGEAILSADFLPEKEMYYSTRTYTTGIADLKFKQTGSNYDLKHGYAMLSEGEERYYGSYNITRSIHMKSHFQHNETDYDWQTCFISGGNDLNPLELRDLGFSPKEVFDCTCSMYPVDGKIAETATNPG
jgi:hypothetical protein